MPDEPASEDVRATGRSSNDASALQALWFLDPASPQWQGESTRMPEATWARMEGVLRREATSRSAEGSATPIFAARSAREQQSRATGRDPRRNPWLIGSVAAGLALLAGGIVVQSVQSTRESGVVVAEAQPAGAITRTAQGPQGEAMLAAAPLAPARRVLASGTDYQPQTLRSQVADLLAGLGARTPGDLAALPTDEQLTTGSTGFTATLPALRACITGLTRSDLAQALVVDRARYAGDDAGLVLIPQDFVPALNDVEPTATAATPSGNIDIWIVEPDCSTIDPGVILHLLHQVSGR